MSQFSTKFLSLSLQNFIILRQFAYHLRQNVTSSTREDIRALENFAIALGWYQKIEAIVESKITAIVTQPIRNVKLFEYSEHERKLVIIPFSFLRERLFSARYYREIRRSPTATK